MANLTIIQDNGGFTIPPNHLSNSPNGAPAFFCSAGFTWRSAYGYQGWATKGFSRSPDPIFTGGKESFSLKTPHHLGRCKNPNNPRVMISSPILNPQELYFHCWSNLPFSTVTNLGFCYHPQCLKHDERRPGTRLWFTSWWFFTNRIEIYAQSSNWIISLRDLG